MLLLSYITDHIYLRIQERAMSSEALRRKATAQCIQLIFRVVERQNLPLPVAATGSILFHRFYENFTFGQYDRFHVAVACCCLAAKVGFRSMSLRDLVMSCLDERYDRKRHAERFQETSVLAFRRKIHDIEQILLLDIIHFDFDLIQGPHSDLAQVMRRYSIEGPKQYLLHQVAWALANDSAYTTLSLTLSSIQLAKGLLELAVEWSEVEGVSLDGLWSSEDEHLFVQRRVKCEMTQIYVNKSET